MPRIATAQVSRFPMQIPSAMKARLMRAAALENTSLKDFVLSKALVAADDAIAKAERLELNEAQSKFLLELLDHPPEPNEKMREAMRNLRTYRVAA